jgi:hypothetical protein
MPFLGSQLNNTLNGYLEVPLGYTGIMASFMTGMWPDKHGVFDLFVPDEKIKKKIRNKYILGFFRLLKGKRLFYTPSKLKAMDYFKPSLDKNWAQKNCLTYPTVFDILEKNKKSFEAIDWPNHFKNRRARIILSKSYHTAFNLAKTSKADFIFVHFLDLELAHKEGVDSEKIINVAKEIDNAVKFLYDTQENVLIFSDHGMDNIEKQVDILSEIKKLNLRFGEDLIYIIGSTTVEFWFKNTQAEEKVKRMLQNFDYGKIVDKKEFHIDTESDGFLSKFFLYATFQSNAWLGSKNSKDILYAKKFSQKRKTKC